MGASGVKLDSCGEVQKKVFSKCLEIIKDREETYGSHWVTEDIGYLDVNIRRKYLGLQHQVENGKTVDKEGLLDLINYVAFRYLKMELEGK